MAVTFPLRRAESLYPGGTISNPCVGRKCERKPGGRLPGNEVLYVGSKGKWIAACKGGPRPMSNFDYAGPLTEMALAGVLALRAPCSRPEKDSANLKMKDAPELDQFVHVEYRRGWML